MDLEEFRDVYILHWIDHKTKCIHAKSCKRYLNTG